MKRERVSFIQTGCERESCTTQSVWVWGMARVSMNKDGTDERRIMLWCCVINHGKSFYEQRWNRWKMDYVVMLWPVKKDGRWYCRLFVYICQVVDEVKKSEKISMPTQMIRRFCWFWLVEYAWYCRFWLLLWFYTTWLPPISCLDGINMENVANYSLKKVQNFDFWPIFQFSWHEMFSQFNFHLTLSRSLQDVTVGWLVVS